MASKTELARNDLAILAAVQRFPQAERMIRRLIHDNEEFHDLCADLADAEIALAEVTKIAATLRRTRRKEWRDLIDSLTFEIRDVLERHGCEVGKKTG